MERKKPAQSPHEKGKKSNEHNVTCTGNEKENDCTNEPTHQRRLDTKWKQNEMKYWNWKLSFDAEIIRYVAAIATASDTVANYQQQLLDAIKEKLPKCGLSLEDPSKTMAANSSAALAVVVITTTDTIMSKVDMKSV